MKIKIVLFIVISLLINFLEFNNEHKSLSFSSVYAQEENAKRKTKKTGSMSEKVAKKLGVAQDLIENEKLDEGLSELQSILAFKKLSPYERGQVNYFLAYLQYLKEDYKGAIIYYQKVVDDENVPDGLVSASRFTIAQLYFQLEDWTNAIKAVDSILANDSAPRPDLYILKGSALYQQKKYREMIPIVEQAITLSEERNAFRLEQLQKNVTTAASENRIKYDKNNFDYIVLANQVKNKLKMDLASTRKSSDDYPVIEEAIRGLETDVKNLAIGPTKEQWWLLLRAAYFELEEMDKVKEVLERLVVEWSKKEYWTQLSAFYGQDRQEESQMAAYQTAYHEGFLEKSSEFVQMAQLYLSVEVPYEAAKLLQKAMDEDLLDKEVKNWKLLSQSWFLAQYDDNAIIALREAAKLSDDGELDIRLARSLSNIADFKGCVDSAKVAINKGDLKRLDDSYITLGMCQFEVAMYEDSKASFASAKIDADARNEIALNECAASEGMDRETLTVTLETQKAFKDMGKEIEGKVISCPTPATVRTVQNWQKFLDKEVERVTLLQNQMKNIEEQLRSGESQALSF
ncbi:tetratricopeptide repeat protein [Gammaproteobacteria bacterium]|nr:tetratricopeptide repeat protein [Gammaproteobacteria bacterium]|tara:strand:+ start:425 stop:2143 length:1719 start_codon:yes stop_codon:yes gene_type:complete